MNKYAGRKHLRSFKNSKMTRKNILTLIEIYSLEHVRFDNAVTFSSFEEQGDLLHLLERHGGRFDGLDGFVGSMQAVDEFTEHLQTEEQVLH